MPGGMDSSELAWRAHGMRFQMKILYCSGFPADALAERNMPRVEGQSAAQAV